MYVFVYRSIHIQIVKGNMHITVKGTNKGYSVEVGSFLTRIEGKICIFFPLILILLKKCTFKKNDGRTGDLAPK